MDQEVVRSWELAVNGHFNRIGALALLMWDFALTFEDERQLFWRKPYTLATYLFIWSRYIGIIVTIFGAVVATSSRPSNSMYVPIPVPIITADRIPGFYWLRIEGWLGITSFWSVEIILQLRIYALYDRSRKIALIMIVAFCIQIISVILILAIATDNSAVVAETLDNLSRCKVLYIPQTLWLFWVAFTAFEGLLCLLAIYKGLERVNSTGKLLFSPGGLQDILIRDSVLYYILIAVVYLANLVLWLQDLPDSLDLMTGYAVALPCVMGSRLMLNVRSAHYKPLLHTILSPSDISLHIPDIPDTPISPEPAHTQAV